MSHTDPGPPQALEVRARELEAEAYRRRRARLREELEERGYELTPRQVDAIVERPHTYRGAHT